MSQTDIEKREGERSAGASGLSVDRAQQISADNQEGRGHTPAASGTELTRWQSAMLMLGAGFEGMPPVPTTPQLGTETANQIPDCSKEACIVNGKQYLNSTDIPGNSPKPLLHTDGTPVLDPEGKPVIGPENVDLEKVAKEAQSNWFPIPRALLNFKHNGAWDFQRVRSDDVPGAGVRPIYTQPYQNFTNVAIGYVLGSLGMTANQIGLAGNTYCRLRGCGYDEEMSKAYPLLPERQVKDYQIGLNLYKERHQQLSEK